MNFESENQNATSDDFGIKILNAWTLNDENMKKKLWNENEGKNSGLEVANAVTVKKETITENGPIQELEKVFGFGEDTEKSNSMDYEDVLKTYYMPNKDSENAEKETENDCIVVGEADPIAVGEADPLLISEADSLTVGEADPLIVGEADPLTVGEADPLTVGEADPLTVGEADSLIVSEADPVIVGEADPLVVGDADPLAIEETDCQLVEEKDPLDTSDLAPIAGADIKTEVELPQSVVDLNVEPVVKRRKSTPKVVPPENIVTPPVVLENLPQPANSFTITKVPNQFDVISPQVYQQILQNAMEAITPQSSVNIQKDTRQQNLCTSTQIYDNYNHDIQNNLELLKKMNENPPNPNLPPSFVDTYQKFAANFSKKSTLVNDVYCASRVKGSRKRSINNDSLPRNVPNDPLMATNPNIGDAINTSQNLVALQNLMNQLSNQNNPIQTQIGGVPRNSNTVLRQPDLNMHQNNPLLAQKQMNHTVRNPTPPNLNNLGPQIGAAFSLTDIENQIQKSFLSLPKSNQNKAPNPNFSVPNGAQNPFGNLISQLQNPFPGSNFQNTNFGNGGMGTQTGNFGSIPPNIRSPNMYTSQAELFNYFFNQIMQSAPVSNDMSNYGRQNFAPRGPYENMRPNFENRPPRPNLETIPNLGPGARPQFMNSQNRINGTSFEQFLFQNQALLPQNSGCSPQNMDLNTQNFLMSQNLGSNVQKQKVPPSYSESTSMLLQNLLAAPVLSAKKPNEPQNLGAISNVTSQKSMESQISSSPVEPGSPGSNQDSSTQSANEGANFTPIRLTQLYNADTDVTVKSEPGSLDAPRIETQAQNLDLNSVESGISPNNEKYQWCYACRKKFSDKNDLILHRTKHLLLNKVKSTFCIICNIKFHDSAQYKSHIETHKYRKAYYCRLCSTQFTGRTSFIQHKNFRCKKKQINSKAYLQNILFGKDFDAETEFDRKKIVVCQLCPNYRSFTFEHYFFHTHATNKTLTCCKCKNTFFEDFLIQKSLVQDAFKCFECSEVFVRQDSLITHCIKKHWLK